MENETQEGPGTRPAMSVEAEIAARHHSAYAPPEALREDPREIEAACRRDRSWTLDTSAGARH